MKRNPKPLLAALLLMAALFGAGIATQAQQLPIALRQDLDSPIGHVAVHGLHNVSVVLDTANYLQVVVLGTADQVDSLRQPLERMKFGGGALAIPADFPYANGINVHTTSRRLHVEATDDSQVWLMGASGSVADTLRFDFLWLDASGHGIIQAPRPVVADQAVLQADDYATLRYQSVASPDMTYKLQGESRVQQLGATGQEAAFRYTVPVYAHRLFVSYSFGVSGWSESPFGGMATPMGDYVMGVAPMGHFDISLGWNFFRRKYWDFGIGFAAHTEKFFIPQLMGLTTDPASGLTHLGPVREPARYRIPGDADRARAWSSGITATYLQFPIRVEWHRRLDYKGVRISAELRPGFVIEKKDVLLLKECSIAPGDGETERIDLLTDSIGSMVNRFRCDFRLDIGWSNVSFFLQGSLTPFFRTARKDDQPALDTRIYPLTMGFSFNI